MRFDFTPEQDRIRQEVREFCEKEVPKNYEDLSDEEQFKVDREFLKKLGQKGWLGLAWPKEYGGQGWTHMEQAIFNEEMSYYRAPTGSGGIAVNGFGNTCIVFGSEEMKKEFLPKVVKGELIFCQGYSEPNAGSDLASLQTRAAKEGDHYIVNGSKMFIGNAEHADYCLLATRTDPDVAKHRGITLFVLPMNTPGITLRPLYWMDGTRSNQMYLDDVKIPENLILGEENRGWYHISTALDFERSGAGRVGSLRRDFEDLLEYVKTAQRNGHPLAEIPSVREKVARLATDIDVLRVLCYRVASMQNSGVIPNYESSMSKLFGSELQKRFGAVSSQIMGLYGQVKTDSKYAKIRGRFEKMHKSAATGTVAAGSSEVQKQIIAQRGLGLPR